MRMVGRITPEMAQQLSQEQETVSFVVHHALLPGLVDWLSSRNTDLMQIPSDDDELLTFIASPRSLQPRAGRIEQQP